MRLVARNIVRGVLPLLVASVGFFHLELLWTRFADGTVLQPLVVTRWLASVAMGAVWLALRRRGLRLFRGRAALVFWLLVVLIHGVGLAPGAISPALQVMPAEILLAAARIGFAVVSVLTAGALAAAGSGRRGLGCDQLLRSVWDLGAERKTGRLALVGPRAPPV